jgi:ATP-dependent DNA helicase RecG
MLYEKIDELEDAENHQAEPEIHQRAKVKLEALVARRRRQVWHGGKIEGVADDDDDQITQPVSRRGLHRSDFAPSGAAVFGEQLFAAPGVQRPAEPSRYNIKHGIPMPTSNLTLTSEVKYLKGVGPARAEVLASRGISTVEELLYYTPFRYEDRTRLTRVHDLIPGQTTTIFAKVMTCGLIRTRRGTFIFDLAAADPGGPGGIIRCKWFHAAYLQRQRVFRQGQNVFFYGKVERDPFGTGNLQMIQPQFEIVPDSEADDRGSLEVGRVVPIYESLGKLGPRVLRRLMATALEAVGDRIPDHLPAAVVRKNKLMDCARAVRLTHFPEKGERLEELSRFRTPAQVRMIFEEFFNVGAGLALRRRKAKAVQGIEFQVRDTVRAAIKKVLPFHPTAAQKRVLKEIVDDMRSPRPMNRLLQGDVGSGKTIVAVQAALVALDNGYQVALMAPTEILATQHYFYIKELLAPLPYHVDLLISARRARAKADLKERIATGAVNLVVGTHALIEEDVQFARLGLAVVDEQHRFGVLQRHKLIRKGRAPDVLVMTATPIPRTLALTLYGDLDFSVIDELPPHRTPIETRLVGESGRQDAFDFVRAKVRAGGQAYVVYPVIEEAVRPDIRTAVRMFEQLSRNVFPEFRVALLHGRLPSEEKESVMQRFKRGEVQILVSTTVIEVGVDVANATVMLIEHADGFGLSQLHQLRGRIGRGSAQSYCLLMAGESPGEVADERLRTMRETTDGFRIAEIDLKLRGPGEFFGTRQWGIPAFRIANLLRDQEILEWAKRQAADFIEHPMSREELDAYVCFLRKEWTLRYGLAGVA